MAIELREAAMRVRNNPSVPHVQAVEAVIEKIGRGTTGVRRKPAKTG
jgi:hypothetical protein